MQLVQSYALITGGDGIHFKCLRSSISRSQSEIFCIGKQVGDTNRALGLFLFVFILCICVVYIERKIAWRKRVLIVEYSLCEREISKLSPKLSGCWIVLSMSRGRLRAGKGSLQLNVLCVKGRSQNFIQIEWLLNSFVLLCFLLKHLLVSPRLTS